MESVSTDNYMIEKITGIAIDKDNKRYYKIQWAPSWEKEENLIGCGELIKNFLLEQANNINVELQQKTSNNVKQEKVLRSINDAINNKSTFADTSVQSSDKGNNAETQMKKKGAYKKTETTFKESNNPIQDNLVNDNLQKYLNICNHAIKRKLPDEFDSDVTSSTSLPCEAPLQGLFFVMSCHSHQPNAFSSATFSSPAVTSSISPSSIQVSPSSSLEHPVVMSTRSSPSTVLVPATSSYPVEETSSESTSIDTSSSDLLFEPLRKDIYVQTDAISLVSLHKKLERLEEKMETKLEEIMTMLSNQQKTSMPDNANSDDEMKDSTLSSTILNNDIDSTTDNSINAPINNGEPSNNNVLSESGSTHPITLPGASPEVGPLVPMPNTRSPNDSMIVAPPFALPKRSVVMLLNLLHDNSMNVRHKWVMKILDCVFSKDELANGNVKGVSGYAPLNPQKLEYVRNLAMDKFPCRDGETEFTVWKHLCIKIDNKHRAAKKELDIKSKQNFVNVM